MISIKSRAYARIGIMGNPSDGFYGKTIAASIRNFYATVTLTESDRLCIIPHPEFDVMDFDTIQSLTSLIANMGCHGGLRLIYATCKKFNEYCNANNIQLHSKNFTIEYDTNIPRQVGLGGSSAIISALWSALMHFYNLSEDLIPLTMRPSLLLAVETDELGINAGLQDRVAIVYNGIIYMDFNKKVMDRTKIGIYERLRLTQLPNIFVAYSTTSGKDSGRMHNIIRQRFESGDVEVLAAMTTFAGYAADARCALLSHDFTALGVLMSQNLALRRSLYSDSVIGELSLHLIRIAEKNRAAVKFPGSGGSVIGLYNDENHFHSLYDAYNASGFYCEQVVLGGQNPSYF